MKLEPGKFYRTAYGKKVSPVRIADSLTTNEWALWKSEDGCVYEVVGLPREEAMDTKFLVEWTDTPKLWRDMTPEEKGALLLAHHEGKAIECLDPALGNGWLAILEPEFDSDCLAYRIRPEPKRETVTLYGNTDGSTWLNFGQRNVVKFDTHRITFDLIDGIPDTTSIRMETL